VTHRRRVAIAAVALVLVLVTLGWWRRARLQDETAAARAGRRTELHAIARMEHRLDATLLRAAKLEIDNAATRATATEVTVTAAGLANEIVGAQRERDDAALAVFYAGHRLADLRTCLDGLERALNQASVGDPGAATSLGAVTTVCRAVGA
jgi:hypothetical protein